MHVCDSSGSQSITQGGLGEASLAGDWSKPDVNQYLNILELQRPDKVFNTPTLVPDADKVGNVQSHNLIIYHRI